MTPFPPGTRVRVRDLDISGHMRTPGYLRGQVGEVVRHQGDFANPEELAYGRPGLPKLPLYLVRFRQADLWPGQPAGDSLAADLYHHWLEPA